MSNSSTAWTSDSVPSHQLAEIIHLVDQGKVTSKSARRLLKLLFSGDCRSVQEIAVEEDLIIVELDEDVYREHAHSVLNLHREIAAKTAAADKGKVNHLVGEMIRQMTKAGIGGAVQPAKAKDILLETLASLRKGQ
jgi:aspartyl-tRNA(Asn)/glutamyl-tRNA(Gln) amidotransferase subunit B